MIKGPYSRETLLALYELGRFLFEIGHFDEAAKIFNGLVRCDEFHTAARVGLGITKLQKGNFNEAVDPLRVAKEQGQFRLQASLALCVSFVASGDLERALLLLKEMSGEMKTKSLVEPGHIKLYEALVARCSEAPQ